MKIAEGIHLIASGSAGLSLTHDNDCNAFAVQHSEGYFLIDCGVGIEPGKIEAELAADGISTDSLTHLLLTHYHLDHCGGSKWFRDRSQLAVMASEKTAAALSSGDEKAISLEAAKRAGVYAQDVEFAACPVDSVLADDETFAIGGTEIRVAATPGHSADMLSYLVQRGGTNHLFCGDTLFFGGKILLSNIHDCDAPALCRSIEKIAGYDFAGFYPGHNLWSVRNGKRHAETAMTYIQRLLLPPSL